MAKRTLSKEHREKIQASCSGLKRGPQSAAHKEAVLRARAERKDIRDRKLRTTFFFFEDNTDDISKLLGIQQSTISHITNKAFERIARDLMTSFYGMKPEDVSDALVDRLVKNVGFQQLVEEAMWRLKNRQAEA